MPLGFYIKYMKRMSQVVDVINLSTLPPTRLLLRRVHYMTILSSLNVMAILFIPFYFYT